MKNTWKSIKYLISLKTVSHSSPSSICDNNKTVTSRFEFVCAFNNYFSKVALNVQSSIKYSAKKFHDFLPPLNINYFYLSPSNKNELSFIISTLGSHKPSGSNSIPVFLMRNDISYQLAVFFSFSFSCGYFLTILKTSKVTTIYKKDSELKCSSYRPILLLSNIGKILERMVNNCLYKTSKVTTIYKKDSEIKCSSYRPILLLSNIDKILERMVNNCLYKFFKDNKSTNL